jgi:hypothetical protein
MHVARIGDMRNTYRILVGNPERKRPLATRWRRWKYNIKMDVLEISLEDVDWIHMARNRDRWQVLVITVMNLRVP